MIYIYMEIIAQHYMQIQRLDVWGHFRVITTFMFLMDTTVTMHNYIYCLYIYN